jgi:DNA end-binding protein Ku
MRPIWSGTIQFGLVTIPVGVYSATSSERISFNMLHKKDYGRIRNRRFCEIENTEVSSDEIVKGYEYEKGEYIEMTDEDFDKVKVESTKIINITDFVSFDEIDPMFFDTPYYLAPGKGANQTYLLLREALRKSGKVGIAKVAIRQREYLAAVKPHGAALMLETMHFADEITDPDDLKLPEENTKIDPRQLKMAEQLIDGLTESFDPNKYQDTYREALLELIDDKLKGHKSKPASTRKPSTTKVVDIMARLKQSLKEVDKKKTTAASKPRAVARKKSRSHAA